MPSSKLGRPEVRPTHRRSLRGILWLPATAPAEDHRARYRADLGELQAMFEAHAADEESRLYPLFERILAR
jgi:hypothetical protein